MPLTGVSGLFGNQTRFISSQRSGVIVSEHTPEDAARMDQSAAKEHARVIADCFKLSHGASFRLCTTFRTTTRCGGRCAPTKGTLRANVERLAGKAEMHLKVLVDDTCPGNSARNMTVGQEYLTSLRESAMRQRAAVEGARAVGTDATGCSCRLRKRLPAANGFAEDAAGHCAPDRQQDGWSAYQNKYSSRRRVERVRMQLSGPWPPLSFRACATRRFIARSRA